ncbi:MAG: hypothetical protein M3O84_07760 [Actinomycetota bacterium]|nr:hypothetical protein [Actinomycetota bacterium]
MKMHDDLRHRLEREAEGLPVGDAPVDRLVSRGRSRRVRHRVIGAVGTVVLVAGVVVPLWLLLGIGGGPTPRPLESLRPASGGETSPNPVPTVSAQHLLGPAECAESLDPTVPAIVASVGAADALSQCSDAWRNGAFSTPDGAVPPLVECVSDSRIIVVPGSGSTFCQDNGMGDVPSDLPAVAARWSNVIDVLRSIESSQSHCLDEATFARRLQDVFDANDFSDWKVVDDFREGYEQRPCAAPAIHYDTLEILLVNDTWS